MGWLDYYYRAWVIEKLLPLFSLSNPKSEAAWHGRAYDRNGLSKETWEALAPILLDLLSGKASWRLNENEYRFHIQSLVSLLRSVQNELPIISWVEARTTLMALDDRGRADALTSLTHNTKGNEWGTFIKPFIEHAWPRQLRYRSEQTVRAFAGLIDNTGTDFPDAVETILPFLRPVPHLDMITYRLVKEDGSDERDLARTYPAATLSLLNALIADDRSSTPYELPKVLDAIADADPGLRQSNAWRRLRDLTS